PFEALADVSEKARLGILSVGYDLDPALDLFAHTFKNLVRQDCIQLALVIWLSRIFCLQQIEQIVRPRQAADMCGLNVIGVLLNSHWCSSEFVVAYQCDFRDRLRAREPRDGYTGLGLRQRADRRASLIRERGFGRFFAPSMTKRPNSPLIRSIATSSLRYQFATALLMPRIASTARRVSRSARNSPRRTPSLTSPRTRARARATISRFAAGFRSAGAGARSRTRARTRCDR